MSEWPSLGVCCNLAALAYLGPVGLVVGLQRLGFEHVSRVYDPGTDTGAYMAINSAGTLVRAWQGTKSLVDAETDLNCRLSAFNGDPYRLHTGFFRGYSVVASMHMVEPVDLSRVKRVVFLGHSLGAAHAKIDAKQNALGIEKQAVRTFGCPRVGDARWAAAFNKAIPDSIRVVHAEDIVPMIPWLCYRHTKTLLHLDSNGTPIKAVTGFVRRVLLADAAIASDIDGHSLECHHIAAYQKAVDLYEAANGQL